LTTTGTKCKLNDISQFVVVEIRTDASKQWNSGLYNNDVQI